jgi:isoleucyl-tRNA synthetase
MLATWHELPAQAEESALATRWQTLRSVRAEVSRVLEDVRSTGGIGSSLQAEVSLRVDAETHELLASLGEDLKFVLICSKVDLQKVGAGDTVIEAVPSPHAKCGRCWHWREDVGSNAEHPELCGRCVSNLHGAGEAREFA